MSEFVIEDGIPLPDKRGSRQRGLTATLRVMKPGQSLLLAGRLASYGSTTNGLQKEGFEFQSRNVGDNVRLWVLKNPLLEGGA